jgi:hypothetical protein
MKNGRLTFKQSARSKAARSQPAAPLATAALDAEPVAPGPGGEPLDTEALRFQPPDLPPADSILAADPTDSVSFPD